MSVRLTLRTVALVILVCLVWVSVRLTLRTVALVILVCLVWVSVRLTLRTVALVIFVEACSVHQVVESLLLDQLQDFRGYLLTQLTEI